jgi:hypothetical protein
MSLTPGPSAWPSEAEQPFELAQLWVYPIKSCAGIRVASSRLLATGLEWDRTWMVVDGSGRFVSQRELPRMALVQPSFKLGQLVLRAPGMLALHLQLDAAEAPTRVQVWDDELDAYDMGEVAAQWFSDFLAPGAPAHLQKLRLARFDPEVSRLSSLQWTGGAQAPNQFGDGYPLLVTSAAAIDGLNQRLALAGAPAVDHRRFRPNLVLAGVEPHDEDLFGELWLGDPAQGAPTAHLALVKPCARCSIPDVDPDTAATSTAVAQALSAYRADARLQGAITYGMNAIVRSGAEAVLHEGQGGLAGWAGLG